MSIHVDRIAFRPGPAGSEGGERRGSGTVSGVWDGRTESGRPK